MLTAKAYCVTVRKSKQMKAMKGMKRRGMKKAAAPEEKPDPRPWKPLNAP